MQNHAVDETTETLLAALRRNLQFPPDEEPFPFDTNIWELGLDSIAAINLLIDLEGSFGIVFPAELLTEETFRTAATLDRAIRLLIQS